MDGVLCLCTQIYHAASLYTYPGEIKLNRERKKGSLPNDIDDSGDR